MHHNQYRYGEPRLRKNIYQLLQSVELNLDLTYRHRAGLVNQRLASRMRLFVGFMRHLYKYRIYLCRPIHLKHLYQLFTSKVGVRLTHEIRLAHALRGSVLGGLCIYNTVALKSLRPPA